MPELPRKNIKRIGNAAEDIVSMFHGLAENQKRAVFWKIPTPTRFVDGKLVYSEKSIVDFLGVLCADGRHIAEEVKHCEGPSFDLAQVKSHQRTYLDKVVAAKGLAVLTVVGAKNTVHVIPWTAVRGQSRVSMQSLAGWATGIGDYFSPAFVSSFGLDTIPRLAASPSMAPSTKTPRAASPRMLRPSPAVMASPRAATVSNSSSVA